MASEIDPLSRGRLAPGAPCHIELEPIDETALELQAERSLSLPVTDL
jgi:hypothetical protein